MSNIFDEISAEDKEEYLLNEEYLLEEIIKNKLGKKYKEGATKDEILAALKVVFLPLGGVAFERGVKAWGSVVNAESVQPENA